VTLQELRAWHIQRAREACLQVRLRLPAVGPDTAPAGIEWLGRLIELAGFHIEAASLLDLAINGG